jgi:hypothetical protein
LRDLHALKETHADEAAVVAWAEQVTAVYARAMAFRDDRTKARRQAQAQFERELARLARPYRNCKEAPRYCWRNGSSSIAVNSFAVWLIRRCQRRTTLRSGACVRQ